MQRGLSVGGLVRRSLRLYKEAARYASMPHMDPIGRYSMRASRERGVALVLVIFIVALSSILVVNLAYSTTIAARQNAMVERALQAEYLLKSAVNFARTLIKEDTSREDGPQDLWGKFADGTPIPTELLGLKEPNIRVSLEIRPDDSKLKVTQVLSSPSSPPDTRWRAVFVRLFTELGFDNDQAETDQSGLFPDKHFDADELVSNLIDYQDENLESEPSGVEEQVPEGRFANTWIRSLDELALIPGFSANRIRKLYPFITANGAGGRVNINFAPSLVIRALDENISEAQAQQIIEFRRSDEGPINFPPAQQEELSRFLSDQIYTNIAPLITVDSTWFQVIAKVDYGTSVYFCRAYLRRGQTGEAPAIMGLELF